MVSRVSASPLVPVGFTNHNGREELVGGNLWGLQRFSENRRELFRVGPSADQAGLQERSVHQSFHPLPFYCLSCICLFAGARALLRTVQVLERRFPATSGTPIRGHHSKPGRSIPALSPLSGSLIAGAPGRGCRADARRN